MPGAEIRRRANAGAGRTGAFVAGQLVGVLSSAANAVLQPVIVLPTLILGFTDSWYLVALPAVLAGLLWVVGARLGGLSAVRDRPGLWATAGTLIRLLAVIALAFVVDGHDRYSDDAVLRAVMVCFGLYVIGSGIASQAGALASSQSVPPARRTGFFVSRAFLGGVAAIVVALVAAALFANDSLAFPAPYAVLFVIAAACLAVAAYFQSTIAAPAPAAAPLRPSAPAAGRPDRGLASYIGFRWLVAASALADPFLVIYAIRDLSASPAVIGLYVAVLAAARLLTEPLWTRLARRGRIKGGLQAVAVIRVLVPALALTLPRLYDSALWTDRVTDSDVKGLVFGLVFAAIGIAQGGQARLNLPYLAQVQGRSGRLAWPLTNAIVATAALAPLLGAWIHSRWGLDEALLVAAGAALLGVLASGGLAASRGVSRAVRGSWQLRRPGTTAPRIAPEPSSQWRRG